MNLTDRSIEEFKSEVLSLANEFYFEYGKWPNELRVGSLWLDAFDEIYNKCERNSFIQKDPQKTIKHWWFMGMRCFREIFTHCVEWTEETEKLKQDLGIMT